MRTNLKVPLGGIAAAAIITVSAAIASPATTQSQFVMWLSQHPGTVHVYDGLNKGVTVGHCGFELVGNAGPFCNVD